MCPALVLGLMCGARPASAQRFGQGSVDVAGRIGTGGVGLALLGADNFLPRRLLEETAFGALQPALGVRVDQTTFAFSTSLQLNTRSELVSAGVSVTYTFLEERLTPVARSGVGFVVHVPESGRGAGAGVSASGVRAEAAVGLRWYVDSQARARSWAPAYYFQFELVGAFLHLGRSGSAECDASCIDGGVALGEGGTGDGMSLMGMVSFGYVTGE